MTAEIFEIEPFRHELEAGARSARGGIAQHAATSGIKAVAVIPQAAHPAHAIDLWRMGRNRPTRLPEPQAGARAAASAGSPEYVRWLQSTLNRAIGGTLPIDGVMSAAVRDAIRDFQRNNRLPVSGYIGPDTECGAAARGRRLRKRTNSSSNGSSNYPAMHSRLDARIVAEQSAAHPICPQVTRASNRYRDSIASLPPMGDSIPAWRPTFVDASSSTCGVSRISASRPTTIGSSCAACRARPRADSRHRSGDQQALQGQQLSA